MCSLASVNALGDVRHPIRAFTAGRAFAAGFMLEEMDCLVDEPIHRDRVIDHDHGSRPKVRAERADGGIVHRRIEDFVIHNDQ